MESRLDTIRNILSVYAIAMLFLMLRFELDQYAYHYNYLQKFIIIASPLTVSTFFWNWKLYSYLNKTAYTNDENFKKTYLNMTIFLTVIIFLFDIGMTYGIFLKLTI